MKPLAALLLILPAWLAGCPALAQPPEDMAEAMVAAHNAWRRPLGLPALSWDPALARMARDWSETLASQGCALRHSPPVHREGAGENVFQASPVLWSDGRREVQQLSPGYVVDSWAGEQRHYNAETNACAPGKQCGHYTQIVWADTRSVGCGMAVCPDKGQVWTCNYRPAGNIVGRRPY